MTPKTFFREVRAAELRAEDGLRAMTTQAWQTCRVYFETQSRKRMPSLKKLLEEIGQDHKKPQSLGEMKAALYTIAAQNKLNVIRKDK